MSECSGHWQFLTAEEGVLGWAWGWGCGHGGASYHRMARLGPEHSRQPR